MRVAVAASGGEGHLGPLLPFAGASHAAGDEVLLIVPPQQERTARNSDLPYRLTPGVPGSTATKIRAAMAIGTPEDRVRLAEVDLFGRACTDAALHTMESVCDAFRPDLILREPCDYASAIVAHRRGIRMAQVAISPGPADWNGLHLAAEVLEPRSPGVTFAVERAPYFSRFPEVDAGFADSRVYGFAADIEQHPRQDPPLVWVTFGTVNTSFTALDTTWRTVLAALQDLPVRAIVSTGRTGTAMTVPPNVQVVEWVESSEILAEASLVICHGGSGTTLAALAAGVPLIVIPLLADQPTNATMVEGFGAGIAIRSGDPAQVGLHGLGPADVPRLRAAISTVLHDDAYAASARRVARELSDRPTVADSLRTLQQLR